jgi:hypothetical protein
MHAHGQIQGSELSDNEIIYINLTPPVMMTAALMETVLSINGLNHSFPGKLGAFLWLC